MVLPMRLNRAPYGSMCDRALWIRPLFTVPLWQAARLKERQSEVRQKNKVVPYLKPYGIEGTHLGFADVRLQARQSPAARPTLVASKERNHPQSLCL